jgi:hypothetical protein
MKNQITGFNLEAQIGFNEAKQSSTNYLNHLNLLGRNHLLSKLLILLISILFSGKLIAKTNSYITLGGYYSASFSVMSGQIAEVTSNITMAPNTIITVERGAMLICVGKTIGSNSNRFGGIEVLGNPSVDQKAESNIYCTKVTCVSGVGDVNACLGSFTHGIFIFDNSTLLNSDWGIHNGNILSSSQSNSNGFLVIKNSTFKGNANSVTVKNSTVSSEMYLGIITGNTFFYSESDPTCSGVNLYKVHLKLENYLRLKNIIKDNKFQLDVVNGTNRIIGIHSTQCGFYAENNVFTNLNFGIFHLSNRPQLISRVAIGNNDFITCLRPIFNFGPDNFDVYNNLSVLVDKDDYPIALGNANYLTNNTLYQISSGGLANVGNNLCDISFNTFKTLTNTKISSDGIVLASNGKAFSGLLSRNSITNSAVGLSFNGNNEKMQFYCCKFKNTQKADIYLDGNGQINTNQGKYGGVMRTVNNTFSRTIINTSPVWDFYSANLSQDKVNYFFNSVNAKDRPIYFSNKGSSLSTDQLDPTSSSNSGGFSHCDLITFDRIFDECGNLLNPSQGFVSERKTIYDNIVTDKVDIEVGGILFGEEEDYKQLILAYDFALRNLCNAYVDEFIFNEDSSSYYLIELETVLNNHTTPLGRYFKSALYLELKDYTKFNNVVDSLNNSIIDDDNKLANYLVKLMEHDTTNNQFLWDSLNFQDLITLSDSSENSFIKYKLKAWLQEIGDRDTNSTTRGWIFCDINNTDTIPPVLDTISYSGIQLTATVSPNPFSNALSIFIDNSKTSSRYLNIKVVSLSNEIIEDRDLTIPASDSDTVNLNTSTWGSGYYYVIISEGDELIYNLIQK